jgi:hypothetical protein
MAEPAVDRAYRPPAHRARKPAPSCDQGGRLRHCPPEFRIVAKEDSRPGPLQSLQRVERDQHRLGVVDIARAPATDRLSPSDYCCPRTTIGCWQWPARWDVCQAL